MADKVTLVLDRNDVGQILDGLQCRFDVWTATADYLGSGSIPEDIIVEECSDSDEANAIADHYHAIIQTIQNQLRDQRK